MRSNGVSSRKRTRDRALIRALNDRIAEERPSGMFIEFTCECGCGESIPLAADEYEAVRRRPDHFAVSPGHDRPVRERVVEACSRFAVVVAARVQSVAA